MSTATVRLPMSKREGRIAPTGSLNREPSVMLGAQMAWLPIPTRLEAVWLNELILVALGDQDGRWAATCLRLGATRLTPQDQLVALWLPLVVGIALLERRGRPLRDADQTLAVLRNQIRTVFETDISGENTVWVIPASDSSPDRSAAHLAAACLRLRGTDARPWLWAFQPSNGHCIRSGIAPGPHDDRTTVSILPVPGYAHISRIMHPVRAEVIHPSSIPT